MRFRALAARVRGMLSKRRLDAEMNEEIEFHLDMQASEYTRHGMDPEQARRRARLDFGTVERVKELHRERRGLPMVETALRDARYGLRMLARNPGFTAVAILSLAVCIGANSAIFSVLNAVVLRPLPYPESDRIVTLFNVYPAIAPVTAGENSVPDYLDRREERETFEALALVHFRSYNVGRDGSLLRVPAVRTTPTLFDVLRVPPSLGRAFTDDDAVTGNDRVAMITYGLWQEMFAGSSNAIGDEISLDGVRHRVVGVMPRGFDIADRGVRVLVPWAFTDEERSDDARHGNYAAMFGRLRHGVSVELARARIDALNRRNLERYPSLRSFVERSGFETTVIGLHDQIVRSVEPVLYVLQGFVALLLLLGCVNIANLNLTRAISRSRELALRVAIGADRARIVRQLITESLLLTLAGGALGLALGIWGTRVFVLLAADQLPLGATVHTDLSVIVLTFAVALAVGLVAGILPAAVLSKRHVEEELQNNNRGDASGHSAAFMRKGLVVAQVALTFVLLIGAALMVATFEGLLHIDPGFRPEQVLTARVSLPETRYGRDEQVGAFTRRAREQIERLPAVRHVAVTTLLPFGGDDNKSTVTVEGYDLPEDGSLPLPHNIWVSGDYFEAMGIPLLEGRLFDTRDASESPLVAVVDRDFAEKYWRDGRALGKRIHRGIGGKASWITVVGIVGTAEVENLGEADGRGTVYFSHDQPTPRPQTALRRDISFVVRHDGASDALVHTVRSAISGLDPELPVYDVQAMETRLNRSLFRQRTPMTLLIAFAGIALLLSLLGIYGVTSYSAAQRTREIGIRVAVGAGRRQILGQMLWQSVRLVLGGLALGVAGALSVGGVLETLLYGVEPADPGIFAIVTAIVAVAAIAAAWIPSYRASRLDVVTALRLE